MIKACEAIIAWNGADVTYAVGEAPKGAVAVGPFISKCGRDWCSPYECTGGAAYEGRRKLSPAKQKMEVMFDWYQLVFSYGLDPYIVHRAFLEINEYQAIIKANGHGPAPDEPGYDQNTPYGRSGTFPRPNFRIFTIGGSVHVWPLGEHA